MSTTPAGSMLIPPYGGRLTSLVVSGEEQEALSRKAGELPAIQISPRSLCDLELLATGAFSPLDRFMGKADYERTIEEMRLSNGTLFPIPVTLPIPDAKLLLRGGEIVLRNAKNELIAVLNIEEIFERDLSREAELVCGTTDGRHPLVAEMSSWGRTCASGCLRVISLPKHYDFPGVRRTPAGVRELLREFGRPSVVALQSQDLIGRGEEEFVGRAAEELQASLLLNPVAGLVRAGDIDYYARVRSYLLLAEKYFEPGRTLLNLLPVATRMAGPRESVWHAIIQRNYGASHLITGPHYADPGHSSRGEPFYAPDGAEELLARFSGETGVQPVRAGEEVRLPASRQSRPEVADLLLQIHPPRRQQGFCVWFTGLPSAGKSTIADILAVMLMEQGRQVTVLDGDVVRTHLSKGLGFSKEDRDANILRIGFVAAEIARHHGAVICAAVSPYGATRDRVRAMVGEDRFVLVHVATPVEVCEQRDVKGMYARARAGEIKGFTGVDDPYEPPASADLRMLTTDCRPEESAARIVQYLSGRGFLPAGISAAISA